MTISDVHYMTRNLILAVFLLSLSGVASATHYSFAGHCYETTADVATAFAQSFPRISETNVVFIRDVSIVNTDQLQYLFYIHNFSNNSVSFANAQITLMPCPVVTPGNEPFDVVTAGSIFSFFFASVVALWFFAKNIGLIIDAVRKF